MLRQLRRVRELRRYAMDARDGDIGKLEELYFDDKSWGVRYFVVNTGTWLLGRRVLIVPGAVSDIDDSTQHIRLRLTRDQVQSSPPLDTEKPISREYEVEYFKHYGWAPYWDASLLPEPHIPPAPVPRVFMEILGPKESEQKGSTLRSTAEVTGYRIEAQDGEIGHVEDFIIDDQDWAVQYVEVDTRNWWPGKKVLVSLAWVDRISWAERMVTVGLLREVIRGAPAYDASQVISRDYEVELYKYYSQRQD